MIVEVDLATDPGGVGLAAVDELDRFHVCVSGGADCPDRARALDRALGSAGAGRMLPTEGAGGHAADGGGDAMIAIAWIRAATTGATADWTERFDAMVRFAQSKGWTDADGTSIQGHVEWA